MMDQSHRQVVFDKHKPFMRDIICKMRRSNMDNVISQLNSQMSVYGITLNDEEINWVYGVYGQYNCRG